MKITHLELYASQDEALKAPFLKEQQKAIESLLAENKFKLHGDETEEYRLSLSIQENRLIIRIRTTADEERNTLILSLTPYRRLIQDYFLMLESYEKARRDAPREKLEAIDMARRSLHNEGADLLQHRLKDKVSTDHETARRLFTLLCSLCNAVHFQTL